MITQHLIDWTSDMAAHVDHKVESNFKGPNRLTSEVSRWDTDVVPQLGKNLDQTSHPRIHINVQIANVKHGEFVEHCRETVQLNLVKQYPILS